MTFGLRVPWYLQNDFLWKVWARKYDSYSEPHRTRALARLQAEMDLEHPPPPGSASWDDVAVPSKMQAAMEELRRNLEEDEQEYVKWGMNPAELARLREGHGRRTEFWRRRLTLATDERLDLPRRVWPRIGPWLLLAVPPAALITVVLLALLLRSLF